MSTNNNNTPLWRELNEKRTKGEWKQGVNTASKEWMRLFCGGNPVLEIKCVSKSGQRQPGDFEKEDANAQYTALAVNNLHILAEALGTVMARLATFTESSAWEQEDQDAYDIGAEALKGIS